MSDGLKYNIKFLDDTASKITQDYSSTPRLPFACGGSFVFYVLNSSPFLSFIIFLYFILSYYLYLLIYSDYFIKRKKERGIKDSKWGNTNPTELQLCAVDRQRYQPIMDEQRLLSPSCSPSHPVVILVCAVVWGRGGERTLLEEPASRFLFLSLPPCMRAPTSICSESSVQPANGDEKLFRLTVKEKAEGKKSKVGSFLKALLSEDTKRVTI